MYKNDPQGTWALENGAPALIALAACVFLAGCGNLTAGGLTGQANLTVSGDAPDVQALSSQSTVGPYPTSPVKAPGGTPEGQVEADFLVFLETATGASVSLSEQSTWATRTHDPRNSLFSSFL